MSTEMKHIVLASRPTGAPTPENFRLETSPIPTPGEGEVLVEVQYMSLDPYMRGRMDDAKSYAAPVPIGGTMEGGSVGRVIDANGTGLSEGDMVFGPFGWATHGVANAKMCRKLDPDQAPVTTSLGVLGMPGLTGWHENYAGTRLARRNRTINPYGWTCASTRLIPPMCSLTPLATTKLSHEYASTLRPAPRVRQLSSRDEPSARRLLPQPPRRLLRVERAVPRV